MLSLHHRIGGDRRRDHAPEHLDLHACPGLQIDRKVCVREVAPGGEPVSARRRPTDAGPLLSHSLPAVDRLVLLAADLQRAQPPADAALTPGQQLFAAVERRLLEADAEAQARLQRVVEQGQVGAVIAVALFHPQRVERAIAARHDARAVTCFHQPVPDLAGPRRVEIQLPAELTDISDTLGQRRRAADADLSRLHERESELRDVIACHALQEWQRTRTGDVDLSERRHVDDAGALSERGVFLRQLVEIRWPRPAKGALVCAGAPPASTGLVVVDPLPAVLGSKHGTEVLHARVQRTGAARPAPLVRVVRIPQEVVVAVGLARELRGIAMVAMYGTETPAAVWMKVELGLPARNPFRQRAPDAAGSAEPVQRQPGRQVQPLDAWHGAKQRVCVGGHRVRMANELHDPGLAQNPPATPTPSVSILPDSVTTASMEPLLDRSMPVTRTPVVTRPPSARAARANACVAVCGSRCPSPGTHTAPYNDRVVIAGMSLAASAGETSSTSSPIPRARLAVRCSSISCCLLDAKRRLPTPSNPPSSRYSSMP